MFTFMDDRFGLMQNRPMTLSKMESALVEKSDLSEEYNSIPQNAADMDEVPQDCLSQIRYVTVLPNQHSRVLLSTNKG